MTRSEYHTCRACGRVRPLELIGRNTVGRPVWECPEGHRQAGPFFQTATAEAGADD